MMASTWSMDGEAVGGFEWPSRRLFVCKGRKEGAAIEGRELKFPGSAPAFSPVKDWIAARSADGAIMLSNLDGDRSFSISQGTGAEPVWCAKTGELFYREGNRWFATKVRLGPSVEWEKPRLVFETEFVDTPGLSYAVSPDGQRLLVVKRVREMPRNKIAVLQNWQKAIAESH
jgi:hypothetical protein